MRRSRARSSRSTTTLAADPAKVNADPMGEGWFLKLRLDDPKELDGLMDEAAYQRFVDGAALMRYLPLTDRDRARHAGGDRRRFDRRAVRRRAAARHGSMASSTCRGRWARLEVERAISRDGRAECRGRLSPVLSSAAEPIATTSRRRSII